jgi:hypothetical protein
MNEKGAAKSRSFFFQAIAPGMAWTISTLMIGTLRKGGSLCILTDEL